MRQVLKDFYNKYAWHMGLGCAFLIPLKLLFAYVVAIPLILLWLNNSYGEILKKIRAASHFSVPFIFLALAITASALFGIDPSRSLRGIPSLFFFSLLSLVVIDLVKSKNPLSLLMSLVLGQSIAALHSVLEGGFYFVPGLFLGKVTESGQLALTIMAALGIVIYFYKSEAHSASEKKIHKISIATGGINTILLTLVSFLPLLNLPGAVSLALCIGSLTSIVTSVRLAQRLMGSQRTRFFLVSFLIPLLLAALLVNLKRGPWAGVAAGTIALLFAYEKRLIIPLVAAIGCSIIFLEPVQTRLRQSSRDFFIAGGRSIIWEIGGEMALRYPLGVGYKNSPLLQKYSAEIPPELKHFHNNFLNILVENGWLTLMLFLWWIIRLIKAGFNLPRESPFRPIAVGISLAFLAWQVAGTVEYNFGDSEVMLLVFLLAGILDFICCGMRRSSGPAETENACH